MDRCEVRLALPTTIDTRAGEVLAIKHAHVGSVASLRRIKELLQQ